MEITGFKSFSQKTVLEFPDKVCAIVGPNGSGKSNIADAIRWVLGEQGQKQIRVEAPTDVIFAGSFGRGRMNMASVKVEFDDSYNTFDLGTSQVVFERKLSRDGIGEFLINKSQARLKDIILYLTKAKAGVKGISVINQGAVDNVLTASSRERYEMILETLGLKELEIKKNDSLKKLEDTRANLKEVKARREEIAPHLKLLRKEKEKATLRSDISRRLKELEEPFFVTRFSEIEKGSNDIAREREEITRIISSLKQQLVQKELELSSMKKEEEGGISEAERSLLYEKENLIYEISRIEAEIKYGSTVKVINYKNKLEELIDELKKIVTFDDIRDIKKRLVTIIKEFQGFFAEKQSEQKTALLEEKEEIARKIKDIERKINEVKSRPKTEGAFQRAFDEYKRLQDEISDAKAKLNSIDHRLENVKEQEIRLEDLLKTSPVLSEKPHGNAADLLKSGGHFADMTHAEQEILKLRLDFQNLGETDMEALEEAERTIERYEFLEREMQDLKKASRDLLRLIADLDGRIKKSFKESLVVISQEFNKYMRAIFGGGHGRIFIKKFLKEEEDKQVEEIAEKDEVGDLSKSSQLSKSSKLSKPSEVEEVIEIDVSLPSKKLKSIESLSGGERALTSIALLFALVKVSEPPFLLLDEVDAALDEVNALKFIKILKELASKTQFILITHNRLTIEEAQILYGVTMQQGVSKVVSLKLVEAEELAKRDREPLKD